VLGVGWHSARGTLPPTPPRTQQGGQQGATCSCNCTNGDTVETQGPATRDKAAAAAGAQRGGWWAQLETKHMQHMLLLPLCRQGNHMYAYLLEPHTQVGCRGRHELRRPPRRKGLQPRSTPPLPTAARIEVDVWYTLHVSPPDMPAVGHSAPAAACMRAHQRRGVCQDADCVGENAAAVPAAT
jgi:hypothetical protein